MTVNELLVKLTDAKVRRGKDTEVMGVDSVGDAYKIVDVIMGDGDIAPDNSIAIAMKFWS